MHRSRRLLAGVAATSLTLSVGLAACGSDDDDSSADAEETSSTTEAQPAGNEGFCTDYVAATLAINGMPGNMGGPDAPQPEPDELKTWYEENLADTIEKVQGEVPDEIDADMQAMIDAVTPIGTAGDPSKMGSPEVSEAQTTVDTWVKDNCENVEVLDVKAVDYGYEGIPTTVEAGLTAFSMENESAKEVHEIAVVRKNDGETKSFEELLKLPDDQAMEHVTIEGMVFAEPEQTGTGYTDLKPGEYLAICFIPQGASEETPDGTGPPHFMLGMQQEFTVQ